MLRISFVLQLVLCSSCLALEAPAPAQADTHCENADIGFLLDGSSTTSTRRFYRAIKLIQGLVRTFDVRLGGSRAGLVTFSDNAETNIDFDKYSSSYWFNREVGKLRKPGGRTRIDRGLDEATVVLYNQRYNWLGFKKYLFVLSDGKQTLFGRSKPNLKERTWLLRHQGVRIIAIAMGNSPDLWYLNQLVQYPEREVIRVPYRANINAKIHQIHRIACSKAPAVPIHCEKIADIGFLLDMSSSIGGPRYFKFETEFVKNVLENFSSEKNQLRAGVILYGKHAYLKIKLNEFTKLESFKKALDQRVKFKGEPLTRIDRALDMANRELFTEANGDRPRVPNYLVLVTDGRQNSGIYDIDHNLIPWFARPLWNRNVTIFAVGVGRARLAQLRKLAGKDGTAIYRRRLRNLKDAVDVIIPSQCKGCHKKVNLGIVMDASGTTRTHFNKIKRLVYYITEGFKPQRTKLQASVIRFSNNAIVDIHFGQYAELNSLQAEVDTKLPFMGGNSYINKGLRAAEREFDSNADTQLPKVLVIITDGKQTGGDATLVRNAANDLRRKGVHIVVVYVQNCRQQSCKGTISAIAGDQKNIVKWKYSDDLITTSEKVARFACPTNMSA